MSAQTPLEEYEAYARRMAARLRAIAGAIEGQVAQPKRDEFGRPDHVGSALAIVATLIREVHQMQPPHLIHLAVQADHATARESPAALLDRATTGLAEKWYAWGPIGPTEDGWMVELAEATLKGAGIL